MTSASGIYREQQCPASAALPHVSTENPDATRGTAVHRYLECVGSAMDAEAALLQVPEEHRDLCESIVLEGLPLGAGWRQEVALALDPDSGAARELGAGLSRDYSSLRPGEIPGTADVINSDPNTVEVADFKADGFDSTCPPARENPQLLFLALALVQIRHVPEAKVGIIHIRSDGTWWKDEATLDAFDLDSFSVELVSIVDGVRRARETVARGLTPEVHRGPWCKYCPALAACPSILSLLRETAAAPNAITGVTSEQPTAESIARALTPDIAGRAYHRVQELEAALKLAKSALWLYGSEHPFRVGDGQVYGPIYSESRYIDARVARREIAAIHGPEVADEACDFETSGAAIERAIRPMWSANKTAAKASGTKAPTLKSMKDALLEQIEKVGGIVRKRSTKVAEHSEGCKNEALSPESPTLPDLSEP